MYWRNQSYEKLPALRIQGSHLRAALRRGTLAWMFGVVWIACISGSHVPVFARMLGFNDFAFGVMAAIPFLATFAQILATVLIERTGLLKYQFLHCATLHRLCWLLIAAIPLAFPLPSVQATSALLVILAASWLLNALAAPAWLTWMGRLIPRRIRGRYFANRARLTLVVQAIAVIIIGVIMDAVYDPALGDDAGAQPVVLWTACGFFVVAAIFGVTDILLFRRVPEVLPAEPAAPAATKFRDFFLTPLRDRSFRSYVLYGSTMTFSITFSAWYFWLNAMENLGFNSLGSNVLFLVFGPLGGFLTARFWGKAIDRWGRKPVLILGTIGTIIGIMPWLLLTNHTFGSATAAYLIAAISCVVGGAVWTGTNLAETNIILGFVDGKGKSRYMAAAAVLISIGGFMGGFAGGALTQSLHFMQANPIHFGPFLWNNWHVAFAVSGLARILALVWVIGMPEPTATRTRDLVRLMRANTYNAMRSQIFLSLRVLGVRKFGDQKHGDDQQKRPK